ncbi:hypothetical protein BHOIPH791_14750 [Bartonella henselae]|uniref:Uncharacterized protein n=4 Tax=Bartonella TaxID=773 RepID=A0A067W7L8_9HYPH|nr:MULTISPECIES: hypothetical protein [Bartonella]KEC54861.1 hypothetical protein O9A_01052 [Bartonella koehlerae C-29]OLL38756.1 hypothetical protein AT237_07730 [Bartonella henselae]OLL46692.1 hypothetical protein AT242_07030 [Bartonella henselae]CDO40080.1 putative transcriptional regulator [Bartonella henselae]CDO46687.1 putative transcriptional regulator [Bartonella henselae]
MIKAYTETAKLIITYLGGHHKVANIINRNVIVVRKWAYSLEKREGKGGIIPAKYQVMLLNYARKHNIDLRPEDFFYSERLQNLMSKEKLSPPSSFVNGSTFRVKSCEQNEMLQSQYEERK